MNQVFSFENKDDIKFKESFDPALIASLYKNFKDPIQAILEILDNAVDDVIKNKTMMITAMLKDKKLSIINKGGTGMGVNELNAFFIWGLSKKRGKLGRYGQGGKAAMGYLGKSWKITSTKAGENREYLIEEPDWDDRAGGLKEYVPQIVSTGDIENGAVKIEITDLKRKISKADLSDALSVVYRPLIQSGQIEIYVDINKKLPLIKFPLEMPEEKFELELSNGKKVNGWISILETGNRTRGGIRCYCFGRLINENEYFGQKGPNYKQSLDRLIGEIYLNLEEIPLTMNKSDFDRGSSVWQEIRDKMFGIMDPYIKILLEEKDRDIPTEKERKIMRDSGRVWADFLKSLQFVQKEGSMPALPIDFGQKPKEDSYNNTLTLDLLNKEKQDQRDLYSPATPPPIDKIGKRKRTGGFPEPMPKSLPEGLRYQLGDEGGKKVIYINSSYPLYKLRKNQLSLYTWETLALEYAKAEENDTQTVEEYISEMDELLYKLGEYLNKQNIKI